MIVTRKHRISVVAVFLATTLSQASLASVIHDYEPMQHNKSGLKIDGDSHASAFGKLTSENAKFRRSADKGTPRDDADSKHNWMDKPIDWHGDETKWENHQSHLNDDKWEKHKNGKPGPIGNPCKSKHCEPPPPAVPVPAAAWLLGSGLIGLIGLARRRTQ